MELIVVKIGGAAGVDAEAVCADISAITRTGLSVIVVHGTSAAADALAARVGLEVRHLVSASGPVSRYTNPEMLPIYVAAAAGQVNKDLVSRLQRLGCDAIGLSGMDGRLLLAERKSALRVVENGRQRVVRDDYSGHLLSANGRLLNMLLDGGYVPVVAPLALGTAGEPLNVDGDRVAALLAGTVGAEALVILSNVPGLLASYPDERTLVRHVPWATLGTAELMAHGRMKKKLLAAREAWSAGVRRVILADARRPEPLQAALAGEGTVFGDATALSESPGFAGTPPLGTPPLRVRVGYPAALAVSQVLRPLGSVEER